MTIAQIVSKIHFLTKTVNANFDDDAEMLVSINTALERVASKIMLADQRWQWDDDNFTTSFPIATTNIVSGQADYTLSTTHLKILRVECAVSSSVNNFSVLSVFDQSDETESLTNLSSTSGVPTRYDELGASIVLYPKPNFSATAGLKVYFQRGPDPFTAADVSTGTKLPGFNSLYHDLIPLWVSYEYFLANADLNRANAMMVEIERKERALMEDYSSRNKNDPKRMILGYHSNK